MKRFLTKVCILSVSAALACVASCSQGPDSMKSNTTTHQPGPTAARQQCVILVHGMLSSPRAMSKIEKELVRNGYHVINYGYDSRVQSIQSVSDGLGFIIKERVPGDSAAVHFVTHSLGALVVRYYLSQHQIANLGRFVMIAPPNQGSVWGRTLVKNIPVFKYILGITGEELQYSSKYRPIEPPPCEFGIISGGTGRSRGINPFIPGDNDATVAVSETLMEGMKDHIVIPGQHTTLLFQKRVIDNIISFLGTGKFIY